MGNSTSAAVEGGAYHPPASPTQRGAGKGAPSPRAALSEEEELLLRGVAEKAVSQLVLAQKEVTRLLAREHELGTALREGQETERPTCEWCVSLYSSM